MQSLHAKLNETLEKMQPSQRTKFYESRKKGDPIECQLNCAEGILTGKVKESRTPITKHNGAGDNGGEVFTESDNSETGQANEFRERSDAVLFNSMGISEADQRRLNNLPPVGTNLTSTQLREFRILRSYRIAEADAIRLARKVA